MSRLQTITSDRPLFVTLNPPQPPRVGTLLHSEVYEHPVFDVSAMAAQRQLWLLQSDRNTWYCSAHLAPPSTKTACRPDWAMAEQLGGVRHPWSVPNQSGRIVVTASVRTRNAKVLLRQ